jgi:hypothetical protein
VSHWETVETQVDDLDLLESACKELGATVLRDAFARGWAGNQRRSDMVIRIPNGKYDLSVTKSEDGNHYVMDGDFFDRSLSKFFEKDGHKLGKILEMYSVHKAENLCRKKRKTWKRVVHPTHIDVEVYV